ncbi:MAG TPA: bifunctional phosphoglucose/phosphomannose isomerase [Chloroflexi bacterium]|nr:bifunctional phosphoglucose/phosphomannose isomerase [Chloroflexota bacterium]
MLLNDYQEFEKLDPDAMLARIDELPQQCQASLALLRDVSLPTAYSSARHAVILGMGGSAIGGALLQGLVAGACQVPITVVRGYRLPAFVQGEDYLVIGCSYSGNTEETLTAFGQALERGALSVAITTGGKLAARAEKHSAPVLRFDYDSQPRAALGYSFTLLLGLFARLGWIEDRSGEVAEAAEMMRMQQAEIGADTPVAHNVAKALAGELAGRLPVIYGAGFLAAVANRWKTQINENAKQWAFFETLPELNHNAVVGLGIPEAVRDRVTVVMLRSNHDHPRMQVRWDTTGDLLARESVATETFWGRGQSKLAQMLSLIHLGDYVSYYLAMLNEVDPTPVETIAYLKQRLAEAESAS